MIKEKLSWILENIAGTSALGDLHSTGPWNLEPLPSNHLFLTQIFLNENCTWKLTVFFSFTLKISPLHEPSKSSCLLGYTSLLENMNMVCKLAFYGRWGRCYLNLNHLSYYIPGSKDFTVTKRKWLILFFKKKIFFLFGGWKAFLLCERIINF